MPKQPKTQELACLCNEVPRERVEDCIRSGAKTLGEIFDQTQAGVGACGGSCRKILAPMLENYLQTGQFPAGPLRPRKKQK